MTNVIEVIKNICKTMQEHKDYLTELDQPIGDSDHGINMARGFEAVNEKLDELKDKDIATILKTVGMTLVSTRPTIWFCIFKGGYDSYRKK